MSKIISVFITNNSIPSINIDPLPTITIYNAVNNAVIAQNEFLSEVGGGFYKYILADNLGDIQYLFLVDAGASFSDNERHYYGSYVNDLTLRGNSFAKAIWEYDTTSEVFPTNSFGNLLNLVKDINAFSLDIIQILLKYQTNRTKLDSTQKTLTIYDNDGTTAIKTFKLYDKDGVLSVENVFDRIPQ